MATILKNQTLHVSFDELCESCIKKILQKSLLHFCVCSCKSTACEFETSKQWVRLCAGTETKRIQSLLVQYVNKRGLSNIVRIWVNKGWLYFKIYDKWTKEINPYC